MNPPAGCSAAGGHDENGVAPDRGAAVFFSPSIDAPAAAAAARL